MWEGGFRSVDKWKNTGQLERSSGFWCSNRNEKSPQVLTPFPVFQMLQWDLSPFTVSPAASLLSRCVSRGALSQVRPHKHWVCHKSGTGGDSYYKWSGFVLHWSGFLQTAVRPQSSPHLLKLICGHLLDIRLTSFLLFSQTKHWLFPALKQESSREFNVFKIKRSMLADGIKAWGPSPTLTFII